MASRSITELLVNTKDMINSVFLQTMIVTSTGAEIFFFFSSFNLILPHTSEEMRDGLFTIIKIMYFHCALAEFS